MNSKKGVGLPLAVLALSGVALAQARSEAVLQPVPATPLARGSTNPRPDMPPLPKGPATVIGGAIRRLDRVQDEIALAVFGGQDMKIQFDERTQVYRDGQRASLKDLRIGDRVSVDTLLDGTQVFARAIRWLTQTPGGEFHGQVVDYDRKTCKLKLRDTLSPNSVVLRVAPETTVVGEGHKPLSTADLVAGALISASFRPDRGSQGVVREITVLALPGRSFMFSGNVTFLDVHAGVLALIDPRDQKRYEVHFDPALPAARQLQIGAEVTVSAGFDGQQYSASAITVNAAPRN
jgi:hypothetical protein